AVGRPASAGPGEDGPGAHRPVPRGRPRRKEARSVMQPRPFTLSFAQVADGDLPHVGGKGANLAALARCGVAVPPGFCVTTRAFDAFIAPLPSAAARFAALQRLDGSSVDDARAAAHAMREALGVLPVPADGAR